MEFSMNTNFTRRARRVTIGAVSTLAAVSILMAVAPTASARPINWVVFVGQFRSACATNGGDFWSSPSGHSVFCQYPHEIVSCNIKACFVSF
jgi:hypothetical protein